MPHGRHIKILGRGSASLLGDGSTIESMLRDLIALLGMRILGEPHMYEVETEIAKLGVEPFEDEGGVTGVCVLSTSHCAIHTWPLRPFFVMDVYSCRDFEPDHVEAHLAKHLGAYDVQVTDLSDALVYKYSADETQSILSSSSAARKKRAARDPKEALRGWRIRSA
jgi:S-adenosylmethionine decarboxylase